jgi:hypothetical protein
MTAKAKAEEERRSEERRLKMRESPIPCDRPQSAHEATQSDTSVTSSITNLGHMNAHRMRLTCDGPTRSVFKATHPC